MREDRRERLDRVYMTRTESETPHGSQRWIAGLSRASERTVERWLKGQSNNRRIEDAMATQEAMVATGKEVGVAPTDG